jgi:hypothetical protein
MLMQQIVTYLAGREFEQARVVGDSLSLSYAEQPDANDAVFNSPSGETMTVPVREYQKQHVAMLEKAAEAGFYTARVSVQSPGVPVAVNVDPVESEITPLDEEGLEKTLSGLEVNIARSGDELTSSIKTNRSGRSSWRFFMMAALVFLLIECLLADRLRSRKEARQSQTMAQPEPPAVAQDA